MSEILYTRQTSPQPDVAAKVIPILEQHSNLPSSHIGLAADVISRIKFTEEQLARFLLFISLDKTTGRYALTFNHEIDQAIRRNDMNYLIYLTETDQRNFYIELFDNPELTSEEKRVIEETYQQELDSFQTALESDRPYQECFNEICLSTSSYSDSIRKYLPAAQASMVKVPASSDPRNFHTSILCLPQIRFVELLTLRPEVFAPHLLPQLQQSYSKEMKMYRRYLQALSPPTLVAPALSSSPTPTLVEPTSPEKQSLSFIINRE
jgi:hypothetical protein